MQPFDAPIPLADAHAANADLQRYYAQRAQSYERIYHKPERQADLRAMEAWLPGTFAGRHVLEVACGTGWWTQHGARDAASWMATDLNPETMAVARHKPMPASVRFATVDAYSLAELGAPDEPLARGGRTFDAAFTGHWWSHVPLARLPGWLETLHARLQRGAQLVMLDNLFVPGSSTPLSRSDEQGNTYQSRVLDDGSMHEVLKNFPTRAQAIAMLGPRVGDVHWAEYGHYWVLTYRLT